MDSSTPQHSVGLVVDEELTRKMAHLARLELTDEEIRLFTAQLGQILGYVGRLQEVDVEGVEPLAHPTVESFPEAQAMPRQDEARPAPVDAQGRPKIFQAAPELLNDGFKVPQIL